MKHPITPHLVICFSLGLGLVSCGGGSGGTGGSGSGTGVGGNGSGTGSVAPASGEYLWETGGTLLNLSYATINMTTGAISAPTGAGSPAGNATAYPAIAVAPGDNALYAFYDTFNDVESFQMGGPGLQLTGPETSLEVPYEESMTLTPSGKFIYVFELGTGVIQMLSPDAGAGTLTMGSTTTVDGSPDFRTGVMDSSGQFMYVNDLTGGRIFAFQVNSSDGSLTAIPGSPYTLAGGALPDWQAVAGQYLYVDIFANGPDQATGIDAYSINSSTGELTIVPGSPFPVSGSGLLCADPSGKFLYASDAGGSIDGFTVNAATGALSTVPGSPFASASSAGDLVIDPSGRFLYLTNYEASAIYGFGRSSTTGSLTPLAGSPFPSVPQPVALTMMSVP